MMITYQVKVVKTIQTACDLPNMFWWCVPSKLLQIQLPLLFVTTAIYSLAVANVCAPNRKSSAHKALTFPCSHSCY